MTDKKQLIRICNLVKEDVKNDVIVMDGSPFTGKIVGEMFGKQGAAIDALASILIEIINNEVK